MLSDDLEAGEGGVLNDSGFTMDIFGQCEEVFSLPVGGMEASMQI
jgi:hypothetical protein